MLRIFSYKNRKKNIPNHPNRDKLIAYVLSLHILMQSVLKDQFEYIRNLQKRLKDFQISSKNIFIGKDEYDVDNTCVICLEPLLGCCSKLACDCKIIIHESCMFKFILGGHKSCPQCSLDLTLEKPIIPKISYPLTIDANIIKRQFVNIMNDEENKHNYNISSMINTLKEKRITDTSSLSAIY